MRRLDLCGLGALLCWSLLLGGCGNLTSGGVGELEVVVAADSVSLSAALQSMHGSGLLADTPSLQAPSDSPRIDGTLTVRIQVFVLRRLGQWSEVTDGVQEIVLPLGNTEPVTIAQTALSAGPYRTARTLFRRVEADIRGGLEIDGEAITGRVLVDLGPEDRLQVETGLLLNVTEGQRSELAVDLHADRWLRRLDRVLRRVSSDHFQDEFRLRHPP